MATRVTVDVESQKDLEAELRQADLDFERGDFVELTPEQLAHCVATGESPWPDEVPD